MKLPEPITKAVQPLFEALPLDQAMEQLVVRQGPSKEHAKLVEEVIKDPAIAGNDALKSGLWLYVDDLDRSHTLSQGMHNPTGAFWHGIMHRREGDFSNSHYWFRNAGNHPAMAEIAGYDPHAFIDDVQKRHQDSPQDLIDLQRREWATLFAWCAEQSG